MWTDPLYLCHNPKMQIHNKKMTKLCFLDNQRIFCTVVHTTLHQVWPQTIWLNSSHQTIQARRSIPEDSTRLLDEKEIRLTSRIFAPHIFHVRAKEQMKGTFEKQDWKVDSNLEKGLSSISHKNRWIFRKIAKQPNSQNIADCWQNVELFKLLLSIVTLIYCEMYSINPVHGFISSDNKIATCVAEIRQASWK